MKIFISSLERHAGEFVPYSAKISLASLGIHIPGNEDGVMNTDIQASHLGDRVLIRGRWEVELQDVCSRCLEQTAYRLEEQFTEEFTRLDEPVSGDSHESEGFWEREDFVYSGEVLDLREYLRQSFLMSQPFKVLCREDCRGLCPVCGVNRNDEECRCQEEKIDPRLRVLEEYKNKKQ